MIRTLLICHEGPLLDQEGLARWLSSFTHCAGLLIIREPRSQLFRRMKREIRRVGMLRFIDVLAFRAWYGLTMAPKDRAWEKEALAHLRRRYRHLPKIPQLIVASPNSPEAEAFIRTQKPSLMLARCKTLLKEQIFSIPRLGTYVMHPGICPEYRNAHGCFWAMAQGDHANVGMTLLRIDHGVDTGPVYGYFRVTADPSKDSPMVIQQKAVINHLDNIRQVFQGIMTGQAHPLNTQGRSSAAWGQPWLSAYIRMKRQSKVFA